MMVTCAIDKTVAVWDTQNIGQHADFQPVACGSKDMSVGKLYSVNFYPSSPWLLGCGGAGNQLALWDLSSETAFEKRFGARLANVDKPNKSVENDIGSKTEDFEAIMAAADQAAKEVTQEANNGSRKKKKNKGKKKAHRAK
jgi:WD40 repeat protein